MAGNVSPATPRRLPAVVGRLRQQSILPSCQDFPFDVSVIIVTYNGWSYVEQCLRALPAAISGLHYEVILVDNGSSDGTPLRARQAMPDIVLIALGRNSGFAAANNRGIAASRGRHVLLLNSDTEPAAGSIRALVDYLDATPETAVVAPRLLNPDGTDQGTARRFSTPLDALFGRTSRFTRLFPDNPLARRSLLSRQHTEATPFEVDQVSGACLLARRQAILQVGLLDERFFFYWEDGDWCRRFKDEGWQVRCLPTASVVHFEHKSSGHQPIRLTIEFHRSVYRYYCKHHAQAPWNPMRAVAALGLAARASVLIAGTAGQWRHPVRSREVL